MPADQRTNQTLSYLSNVFRYVKFITSGEVGLVWAFMRFRAKKIDPPFLELIPPVDAQESLGWSEELAGLFWWLNSQQSHSSPDTPDTPVTSFLVHRVAYPNIE